MATNWYNKPLNTYIESRRTLGLPTPAANWTDARVVSGKATPMANVLGYKSTQSPIAEGTPCPTGTKRDAYGNCVPDYYPQIATAKEQCIAKGGTWVLNSLSGQGYCDTSGKGDELPDNPYDVPGAEGGPKYVDQAKYENWTPQDQSPIPWITMGPYADALANMLNTPAFGGKTLEELENARIQAMKAGSAESYNQAADEITKRLNQEAAAKGMFSSGARMQGIGTELGELSKRRVTEEMAQEAAIRGERPQLLLQERQQRADIANIWGQMDINSKGQNLDAMLNNKLMEYDRQFKNGQLGLEAFNGNMNMLGLFLDYQVSRARTNAEVAQVRANIDSIYSTLNDREKSQFMELISMLMGAFGGSLGRG